MLVFFVACALNSIQKVEIQNWPVTPWYEQWGWVSSIGVLVILIIESIRARKAYIRSIRPFVSASNFAFKDNNDPLVPICMIGFQLTNAPARIISLSVKILIAGNEIYNHEEGNFVRFMGTQWTLGHNNDVFVNALKGPNSSKLIRKIEIKYSPLDNEREYFFKLEQKFDSTANTWHDTYNDAN